MPAVSTAPKAPIGTALAALRIVTARRIVTALVAATLLVTTLLVTGCQTLDDAGPVIGQADLVTDLAARLDRSSELTYSAEYQLPGGRSASISQSQQPLRSAYTYPGGKLTVTDDATTECATDGKQPTCTLRPPPPTSGPSATVFAGANKQGLVAPLVVVGLLTAAALDPNALIQQTDTTVAGRHATCVQVRQLSNALTSTFDTCIITEGALGSFTGVVNGNTLDVELIRYRDAVESTAFDLPPGAGVVDRRSGPQ